MKIINKLRTKSKQFTLSPIHKQVIREHQFLSDGKDHEYFCMQIVGASISLIILIIGTIALSYCHNIMLMPIYVRKSGRQSWIFYSFGKTIVQTTMIM